jgi:hypothetical protein
LNLINNYLNNLKELKMKYHSNQIDPYAAIPYGDYHPTFIPYDYYFLPVIFNFLMMISMIEQQILADYFYRDGISIEKGEVVTLEKKRQENQDHEDDDDHEEEAQEETQHEAREEVMEEIENSFLKSFSFLESYHLLLNQPPIHHDAMEQKLTETKTQDEEKGMETKKEGEILVKEKKPKKPHQLSPFHHYLNDLPEFSISKEILKNLQQLLSSIQPNKSQDNRSTHAVSSRPVTAASEKVVSDSSFALPFSPTTTVEHPLTSDSLDILTNHNINLEPQTGKIVVPEVKETATKEESRGNKSRGGKLSRNNSSIGASSNPPSRRKSVSASNTSANKTGTTANSELTTAASVATCASVTNPLNQYKSNLYIPMIKDRLSLFSEVIYSVDNFGRDEINGWITFTLSSIGGVSLGYLGQSVLDGKDLYSFLDRKLSGSSTQSSIKGNSSKPPSRQGNTAVVPASNPASRPTTKDGNSVIVSIGESGEEKPMLLPSAEQEKSFLLEIKNRLIEIETKLTLTPSVFYDYNIDPSSGNILHTGTSGSAAFTNGKKNSTVEDHINEDFQYLSLRILLLIILIKIMVTLLMKAEISQYLQSLEKLTKILHSKYRYFSVECVIYKAIAAKYRYEYDEWCLPCNEYNSEASFLSLNPSKNNVTSASDYLNTLVNSMLPLAKKYYDLCIEANNIIFIKDSLKKLINCYLSISRLPIYSHSSGGNAQSHQYPTGMGSSLSLSSSSAGGIMNASSQHHGDGSAGGGSSASRGSLLTLPNLANFKGIPLPLAPTKEGGGGVGVAFTGGDGSDTPNSLGSRDSFTGMIGSPNQLETGSVHSIGSSLGGGSIASSHSHVVQELQNHQQQTGAVKSASSLDSRGGREGSMISSSGPAGHRAPTMEELLAFDEAAINENETNQPMWVYRFAKLRAMFFMKSMKDLANNENYRIPEMGQLPSVSGSASLDGGASSIGYSMSMSRSKSKSGSYDVDKFDDNQYLSVLASTTRNSSKSGAGSGGATATLPRKR